ncbi:uncharacterized protein LOC117577588 isoform X1 [Drosophila albomicans]|uniref:Uncharacterized protein LOC117577588 isoform X1 n=2 Tax=Drosophila albomicans TaxID=7291 RepID=A0A6P8XXV6_DROAB|nr:uncharacterized protein LOC117577588 isoform X1 [Drosophila albomicans]
MQLQPHRYEHYKTLLRDLLQSVTTLIRNYVNTLKSQTPNLITQANRLWELRQRQRLVMGVETTAANNLLTASNAVYQQIYQAIESLLEALDEIAKHIEDFERISNELREEAQQNCELPTLSHCTGWLLQTLSVLQTQAKYLELHTRSLHPAAIESTTAKQLQKDLQLVKEYELNICMGIAKAERQQLDILPPLAITI